MTIFESLQKTNVGGMVEIFHDMLNDCKYCPARNCCNSSTSCRKALEIWLLSETKICPYAADRADPYCVHYHAETNHCDLNILDKPDIFNHCEF